MFARSLFTICTMFAACPFDLWYDLRVRFQTNNASRFLVHIFKDALALCTADVAPGLLGFLIKERMVLASAINGFLALTMAQTEASNMAMLLSTITPQRAQNLQPFLARILQRNPALITVIRDCACDLLVSLQSHSARDLTILQKNNKLEQAHQQRLLALAMMYHTRLGAACPELSCDLLVAHMTAPQWDQLIPPRQVHVQTSIQRSAQLGRSTDGTLLQNTLSARNLIAF